MKIKVSDYIARTLAENGIDTVFTVVGGGAMHLNDSLGHSDKLRCVYQHHEQACSIAAEGYTKATGRMAAVCVTSGPGAINALNGVAGAYQDSIPMIVLSGQVKTSLMVRYSGLRLRTLGGQEFDIVSALTNMAKYAESIDRPERIRYCLEKAIYLAKSGRPGPCWLDVPLDIQSAVVDEAELEGYEPYAADSEGYGDGGDGRGVADDEEYRLNNADGSLRLRGDALKKAARDTAERLRKAKRPVLYAGNGIRLAGAYNDFRELVTRLGIPVVTCWDSVDLIETEDEHYAGRGGTMGDRAGNFAVQNSDLVLAIGNRLSIYQVGYDVSAWARAAYIIDVDIDPEELEKPTIRVDMPVCADAGEFIAALMEEIGAAGGDAVEGVEDAADGGARTEGIFDYGEWLARCNEWKRRYPVVSDRQRADAEPANVYAFIDALSRRAGEGSVTVASNGSASVVGSQTYHIARGQRFILNCALSSMGYGLPAAVGAAVGTGGEVICLEGDGSLQMNLQELQTVVTNRLPIKLFVINNLGYHQIRQTQNNIFHNGLIGVGPESGDLGFPSLERLSYAYEMPYFRIERNSDIKEELERVFACDGYCICEVLCDTRQIFEPKSATKKLPDGTLVSPPLEDMAPFLPREELEGNMLI